MSNKVLEELYDGNIRPAEWDLPREREYQRLKDGFSEHWQTFFKSIPKESKKKFFGMEDEMNHIQYLRLRSAFVDGFRMGVTFILESTK